MLLNTLECIGQPLDQNYLTQMSVVPRLRDPTILHSFSINCVPTVYRDAQKHCKETKLWVSEVP